MKFEEQICRASGICVQYRRLASVSYILVSMKGWHCDAATKDTAYEELLPLIDGEHLQSPPFSAEVGVCGV